MKQAMIFDDQLTKDEWMELAMDLDEDLTEDSFEVMWQEFERVREKRRAN